MTDLNVTSKVILDISDKRMNNGANIKTDTTSMLKHCATEVVEAMQAYTRWNETDSAFEFSDYFIDFREELADIICCVLIIAAKERVNIEEALLQCVEKNRKRSNKQGDKL